MKPFSFRLKGLVKVKSMEELQCRQMLARLEGERAQCLAKRDSYLAQARSLSVTPEQFSFGAQWQARADFLDWLTASAETLNRRMECILQERQPWIDRLGNVMKSKKSLDHYRDRLMTRHISLLRKKETQALDSLATRSTERRMEKDSWNV